jgi:Mg2+-importing ATPase
MTIVPAVRGPTRSDPLTVLAAAAMPTPAVLAMMESAATGLSAAEAQRRLAAVGPNAIRSHAARWPTVLARQVRSPLLALLGVTAAASFVVGQHTDAAIIAVILTASVSLGFGNEFRAERAAAALHSQLRHTCTVWRDGTPTSVDVIDLVPGDVVELRLGQVVPADVRLLETTGLSCDESTLSGESAAADKSTEQVAAGTPLADLTGCALMGTVVRTGSGRGVVVTTGARAEFGRIAAALGEIHPETEFQVGLRKFSMLLVRVAAVLVAGIFLVNLALDRPPLDALLFSLAIAVGISPQLLPAVVSTSLAAGSRQLAGHKVLVKRLICIEDLGDMEVLFTDKTGTLTEGRLQFIRSVGVSGHEDVKALLFGLLCSDVAGDTGHALASNPLDAALWRSPATSGIRSQLPSYRRLAVLPFDHDRRLMSVLVSTDAAEPTVITKGAPEEVLLRCGEVPAAAHQALAAEFDAGHRVVAVATGRGRVGSASPWHRGTSGTWSFRGCSSSWTRPRPPPDRHWDGSTSSASTSRSSPGTTPSSPRRCARTSDSRPAAC